MIKAVFFDIDGTLVSFKTHRVPDSTLDVLAQLRSRGIKVFIATGRHELLIDNVDTELFDGIVSLNGQCVRAGGEIIHVHAMPEEDARAAERFALESGVSVIFEGTDFLRMNIATDTTRRGAELINLGLPPEEDITGVSAEKILQLIVFTDEDMERKLLAGMPSCESTRWTHLLCDVIPKGGGKHIGIGKMLDRYGIGREECMALGDGENDITMLRYAGIGVAMGNAADEVKAAADYVTGTADEDGVAAAMRRFGIL